MTTLMLVLTTCFLLLLPHGAHAVSITPQAIHKLGETCGARAGAACESDLVCYFPEPLRLASPGYCVYRASKEGEACSMDSSSSSSTRRQCAEGLVCSRDTHAGTQYCVAERQPGPNGYASIGQKCEQELPCVPNADCVANNDGQTVCKETLRGVGEICEGSRPHIFQCQLPLQCVKNLRKPLEIGYCLIRVPRQ